MRLGAAHELGFAVAMLSAILIVLFGGELPPFAWLTCLAPVVSALLALRGRAAPALSATLVGLASLALGAVTVARSGVESAVLAGGEVLLGLLCARLLVRKTPAHDLQAILLSLLLVLAGSVLNVGINYIFVFVVYAVAAVWALSTRQLLAGAGDSERGRVRGRTDVVTPAFFGATAFISLATLASAAMIFALFPRVGFGDIGAFLKKESKLPTQVGLRGDPRAGGGTEVVARVKNVPVESFEAGLYLRGAVYDVVNMDGFSQSPRSPQQTEKRYSNLDLGEAPRRGRYEVTLMPLVGDTLLTLGGVDGIRTLGGGAMNPNFSVGVAGSNWFDEVKAVSPLRSPLRYEVAGSLSAPAHVPAAPRRKPRGLTDDDLARWTALPPQLDERLVALAASAVGGATTPTEKAAALRRFFLGSFVYSQDPPRFAESPLRTFLLDDRQGHCEYFAAAFALLLRTQGIPSRVVGGFQGGALDDEIVVFQERHAHAWVEWWDDTAGWIVDDATPLATAPRQQLSGVDAIVDRARRFWDDRVLDYSMQDQMDSLTQARRQWRSISPNVKAMLLGVALPAALAVALVVMLRLRGRRQRAEDIHPLARAIVDAVARGRREEIPAAWTVREAVASVPDSAGHEPLREALQQALAAYERSRFGGVDVGGAEVRRHARALRQAARTR